MKRSIFVVFLSFVLLMMGNNVVFSDFCDVGNEQCRKDAQQSLEKCRSSGNSNCDSKFQEDIKECRKEYTSCKERNKWWDKDTKKILLGFAAAGLILLGIVVYKYFNPAAPLPAAAQAALQPLLGGVVA